MKKRYRLAALILVLAFLLCACTQSAPPPASEPAGSEPAESEPAGSSSVEPSLSEAAQKYPSEQVITWYAQAAGDMTDTIARILIPYLSEELGQSIVVENLGGAGGMNQMNPVMANPADGYSIASLAVAFLCMTPYSSDCTYDYTDFEMLYSVFSQPQTMVVRADAPYDTFEEWAEYVKANPGKFRFGVSGASTVHNLCLQGLKLESGLDYDVIYYSSGPETTAALLGGHIEGMVNGHSAVLPNVESGDFKIIAFTTEDKPENMQDIPSLADLGYESRGVAFQGICIKAGTDPDVVAKLKAAFDKVFANPEVIEQLKTANVWIEGTFMESAEFTEVVKSTYEWYGDVLNETGLMEQLYG